MPNAAGGIAFAVLGLGEGKRSAGRWPPSANICRRASIASRRCRPRPTLATLGWALGTYRFARYRKDGKPAPKLVVPDGVDGAEISRIAEGVFLARDLINTPPNDMGPEELSAAARDLAKRHGAKFSEIVGDALLKKNYPLIHAVGKGSARAPRLVDLVWGRRRCAEGDAGRQGRRASTPAATI